MAVRIDQHQYGKGSVRVLKLKQSADFHQVIDLTVDIMLEGDLEDAYTKGDNTEVLPTDTMKNSVYAMASEHHLDTIESFAMALASRFLDPEQVITAVQVDIAQHPWHTLPHPHAFQQGNGGLRTCSVDLSAEGIIVSAGIEELNILKTAKSGFSNFLRDDWTTLKDTDDRLFGTDLTANWVYGTTEVDFDSVYAEARDELLRVFAEHDSLSVQHTLHAMGTAVLDACPDITEISLSMPNVHRLLVDLSPFGMENKKEIFQPVEEPYGVIEATLKRG